MSPPRTLFEKIWDAHVVRPQTDATPAVLYIDLHLVHEVTSAQAFTTLRERRLHVHAPGRTLATMDHSTPTSPGAVSGGLSMLPVLDHEGRAQLEQLARNCDEFDVPLVPLGDERQGIVHVIGPELGLTRPGMTIVCGDSHTSTHGAFGAVAFGIGTSQVAHVLATQCLLQRKPKTMEVRIDGTLSPGVSAKDVILAVCARLGIDGGTGHAIEYTGSVVRGMSMEERMTVCNMSIEAGARAGMIAPDATTIDYVRRHAAPDAQPSDDDAARWLALRTDRDARYDRSVTLDVSTLAPMITYGTNPGMGMQITDAVPDPEHFSDATERTSARRALEYMGFTPGQRLIGKRVDVVFLGSCTNSRLSDLRAAASLLRGRHVADGVRMLVVPGSQQVKRAAEREGLDRVFRDAGAEWREAGCSMCIAMNGDRLEAGQLAVSTSNRNFEGRQGSGSRTLLASPITAAAAAIMGAVADPRPLVVGGIA